jgi:hypothetical protein
VMAKKMVPQTVLLESTARLLTVRFKLGLFEPNNSAVPKYGLEHVDSVAHRALALKQARQGIVLLQNKPFQQQHGQHEQHKEQTRRQPPKSILPLDVKAIKRVAMIGPNANASLNLLSGYHGTPPFLVTPLQAMQAAFGAGAVGYAVGCNVTNVSWGGIGGGSPGRPPAGSPPPPPMSVVQAHIAAAVSLAKASDVAVVGLGLCGDNYWGGGTKEDSTCFAIQETETTDRLDLELPGWSVLFCAVLSSLSVVMVALDRTASAHLEGGTRAVQRQQLSGVGLPYGAPDDDVTPPMTPHHRRPSSSH